MLKRLRVKFVCINMLIVAVMLCGIFGTVLLFTARNLEMESIRTMQAIAARPLDAEAPDELREEVRLPYFKLEINQEGQLAATGGGYFDLSDEDYLREVLDAALATHAQTGVLEAYKLRFCRVVTPTDQCVVFTDMTSEHRTMQNLLHSCLFIGAVSFLAFWGVSLLLARWAVRPVARAWDQQRQFVADASHELKTPLTVILTNAELLQGPARSQAERDRFAGYILTMAHQMRGLVENLLELARVDSGLSKADMETVDWSRLVSEAALPFEPLYYERGLKLCCDIEEGLVVRGSSNHLRQVVEILLDNALKYTPPPAAVTVRLRRQGLRLLLSVSNPGPPMAPAELKNIFKRFYRLDQARSARHSYGLGLPIAQGVVRQHRGRIWAESREGRNSFFVELPGLQGPLSDDRT